MVLGGSGAGIALSSVGTAPALVVDLASFALATLLYLGLPAPTAPQRRRSDDPSGARYLLGRPRLLVLVLAFAAATLATGLTNASLPSFLGTHLGLGAGAYGFGLAALGVGLTLGGVLVGFLRVGPSAGRWIGLALAMMAALFFFLGAGEHAATALLLLGVIGFLDATTDVLFDTVIQREADPRYYGSVFGVASALMMTTMVAGFVAAPLANNLLGAREAIVASGVVLGVAGVTALVGLGPSTLAASAGAAAAERHLRFVPGPTGYAIVEHDGPAPAAGAELESAGRRYLVAKLARSPFPDGRLPCAYLQEQPAGA
jgi:predicted MFS family arabinose efflux permease